MDIQQGEKEKMHMGMCDLLCCWVVSAMVMMTDCVCIMQLLYAMLHIVQVLC